MIALICHCVGGAGQAAAAAAASNGGAGSSRAAAAARAGGAGRGPFLVLCPASVMSSWAAELARWAPALAVVQYKGAAEARADIWATQVARRPFHVLLTSYELAMGAQDRPRLARIAWQAIVVDEGHRCAARRGSARALLATALWRLLD